MLNTQNINDAKNKLISCNPASFVSTGQSFRQFVNRIEVIDFRSLKNLNLEFEHGVTVIAGSNRVGKTSILLLIAGSHYEFRKYDATKPDSVLRRHTWKDVISFTHYETVTNNYSYKLTWRIGPVVSTGEGKRTARTRSWTGLAKFSSSNRTNAQIKQREVRLIDLERLLPARNFSKSLLRKISGSGSTRVNSDVEQAFGYIFDIPGQIEISVIGSHINKFAYLIKYGTHQYSTYNAASGEESLINILNDIFALPDGSLILIDEIEAGFHPLIQRKLADIIQYISWRQKKQFIITTHSPSVLAAFPQKSRKFIDKDNSGNSIVTNNIPVNFAFSKMDSIAYPILRLYCEDDEAAFIIKNILLELNANDKYFDRLIDIIQSGPASNVKIDYDSHKRNYSQTRIKQGYCCVFDGDYESDPNYASYKQSTEFGFFLYPYKAPEKFLIEAYLNDFPNSDLESFLQYDDHHFAYRKMTSLGLATDEAQARQLCWQSFKATNDFQTLSSTLKGFIKNTVEHFSQIAD